METPVDFFWGNTPIGWQKAAFQQIIAKIDKNRLLPIGSADCKYNR